MCRVLTSFSIGAIINTVVGVADASHGGVAQLVERLNGIQEVRGSTPLISTTAEKNEPDFIGFFFFSGALRGDAVPPAA